MAFARGLFICSVTILASYAHCEAATITVDPGGGGDHTQIQPAIDAAVTGDTVLVAGGVYTGTGNQDLDFKGKAITVESMDGPGSCIIDCESTGLDPHRGFYFHTGESRTSVLRGFTIRNGFMAAGGGIRCDSSPTIENCVIWANSATNGGGLYCGGNSSPALIGCRILENEATSSGGGIHCTDNASPLIQGCLISQNSTSNYGGAFYFTGHASPSVMDCTILGNMAGAGAGVYSTGLSSSILTNCVISSNSAGSGGGGVACGESSILAVTNCTIARNSALNGGGLYCGGLSSPTLKNCIIWFNVAATSRSIFIADTPNPQVTYSSIEKRFAGEGNIDRDPSFMDPGGDYHLHPASPCIDSGTSDGAPAADLEGTLRPQGNGVEMGALEYSQPPLLVLNVPENVTLTPSHRKQYYTLAAEMGTSVLVTLTDPDPADFNAFYIGWGDFPETYRFDLAAEARNQASQKLVIPYFRADAAYLLVIANQMDGDSSDVTLLARPADLELGGISTTFTGQGGTGRLDARITGVGFQRDTAFNLRHRGSGASQGASETVFVSSERAEVVFQLSGAMLGKYDLIAANPGSPETTLEEAFEVLDTRRGAILTVGLSAPERYRYNRLSRITLRYANTGDQEMTAPLFKVVGPAETDLRLERESEFQGSAIQVMGIDPNGVAGKLPPGAKGEIPMVFQNRSESEANFQVYLFAPNREDLVGWESIEAPDGMAPEDWEALWPGLSVKLGASWLEVHEALAERATRLARRGVDASSARELFRFAAREAYGRPGSAIVGRVRDGSSGIPLQGQTILALLEGDVRSSAVSGEGGLFLLDWLQGARTYEIHLVEASAGDVQVAVPEDGDALGIELFVAAEANGLLPGCPGCDESGLPARGLRPPERLFTPVSDRSLTVISPIDPNEKQGPTGDLGEEDEILYTIYFENLSTATAWAQRVIVRDRLDPSLDWSTFRLRDIGVGGEKLFSLDYGENPWGPPILSEGYSGSRLFERMGPSGLWLLHVYCEFDLKMGVVQWVFQTLDPATGLPPDPDEYPDAGFLPPDDPEDETHCGEGHVAFTLAPGKDLEEDTEIVNQATISFEDMTPLATNAVSTWIIRSLPPEEPRNPFPASATDHRIELDTVLSWSSTAETYDVYLWKEGEPKSGPVAAGISQESYSPAGLEYDTRYLWQVVARTQSLETAGPEWVFLTVKEPPLLPGLPGDPSPPQGALNVPRRPLLSWSQAAGASGYEVFLWPEGETAPDQPIVRLKEETSFAPPAELEFDRRYRWLVVAFNRTGKSVPDDPWYFRTITRSFKRGDVDDDGDQDITDVVFGLVYLFLDGQPPPCAKSLDTNDDAQNDISDTIILLFYLFLGDPTPSEPLGNCGPDPTEDELTCRSDTCTP